MYRLATRAGVINHCQNVVSFQLVPCSTSLESMGLAGLLDNDMALLKDDNGNWKGKKLYAHMLLLRLRQGAKECQGAHAHEGATTDLVRAERRAVSATLVATRQSRSVAT